METIYRTAIISTQICRSGPLVVPCPLTWDSALVAAPAATPILCRSNRGFAAKWHVNGHATTMLHLLAGTAAQTPSFRYSQPRGIKFPACGNIIPSRWESNSQPVGTLFPAAGNQIPSLWEHYSQPVGTLFPACGNQIPSRWESNSQPLGIEFPACGNRCPKGCGNFIRGDRGGFPPPQKHVA